MTKALTSAAVAATAAEIARLEALQPAQPPIQTPAPKERTRTALGTARYWPALLISARLGWTPDICRALTWTAFDFTERLVTLRHKNPQKAFETYRTYRWSLLEADNQAFLNLKLGRAAPTTGKVFPVGTEEERIHDGVRWMCYFQDVGRLMTHTELRLGFKALRGGVDIRPLILKMG